MRAGFSTASQRHHAVALVAVYAVLLVGFLLTPDLTPLHGLMLGLNFVMPNVLAMVSCVRAARSRRIDRRTRQAWWLIAVYSLLVILSLVGYAVSGHTATGALRPSPGDVPHLLSLVVMLSALLRLPTHRRTRAHSRKDVLDIATVVACGFMAMWYLVLGPELLLGGLSTVQILTAVGYPIGDLALIFGAVVVLVRGTATGRQPVLLLVASLTMLVIGDTSAAYRSVHTGGSITPWWFVVSLSTAWFLLAFAGQTQYASGVAPGHDPAALPNPPSPLRPVSRLPYAAAGLAYAMLLVAAVRQGLYPWVGLVMGATVVTAAVAARQLVVLHENHQLVVTDSLTGLANRVELHAGLSRALERAARTDCSVTVLQIDVNSFKQINDTLGHDAGDQVLVGFAAVLRRSVLGADIIARLGGDEFVLVLETDSLDGDDAGVAVARRVIQGLSTPIDVNGQRLFVAASLGIASLQGIQAAEPEAVRTLLHRADTAMYVAKQAKPESIWQVFCEGMEQEESDSALLASDLRGAVMEGQLRVHYQPIVALETLEITGVEALLRWQHPTRGLLLPGDFIELAEKTGAIDELGAWVFETAAHQVVKWQHALGRRLQLNVNISPRQLERAALADEFAAILARTGLDPADLVLEVTESAVVSDDSGVAVLVALRALGIRIALDDFGTGYSSLRYLTRLPVDTLKLDRCFVDELDGTPDGSVVASAVIRLSDILHLDLVAEGIETAAQLAELTLLGCRTGQGYFIARPLETQACTDFMSARVPAARSEVTPRGAATA